MEADAKLVRFLLIPVIKSYFVERKNRDDTHLMSNFMSVRRRWHDECGVEASARRKLLLAGIPSTFLYYLMILEFLSWGSVELFACWLMNVAV